MEEIHEGVIEQNMQKVQKEEYEKIKKKIQKQQTSNLFKIDEGQKKRAPLDPNRFKKKMKEVVEMKADLKLVNKLAREGKTSQKEKVEEKKEELEWKQTDKDYVEYKHKVPRNRIAAVVEPHAGQSYNPSYEEHQQLLDSVVQKEQDHHAIKVFGSSKSRKLLNHSKKIKKLRNKKAQKVLDEQNVKKQQKQLRNEVSQMNVSIREIDLKNEKIREQHQIAAEKVALREAQEKKGIVERSRFGKHRYEMRDQDFQLENDLSENLRRLKAGNDLNIKDRFDTIYRTKMLQKSTPWKAKAKPRVPRFKVTDLNRRRDDKEDEQLGNFQDKLDFKTL